MRYCTIRYTAKCTQNFARQLILSRFDWLFRFRDNNEHSELLQQFKSSEDNMKEQVLSRIESIEDVRAPDITTIETFQVESTGASISTLCSVSLLHHYCARLAHDR